jgi:hypothetical protein
MNSVSYIGKRSNQREKMSKATNSLYEMKEEKEMSKVEMRELKYSSGENIPDSPLGATPPNPEMIKLLVLNMKSLHI